VGERQYSRAPLDRKAVGAQIVSRATPIEFSPQMLAGLSPLFAAFGLVLVIACANVSNMMMARALSRQREIGIRISLGAGRIAAVWRPPIYDELVKLAVIPSGGRVEVFAGYNFVSPEYFSLLRIPLVRGRIFTGAEAQSGADVVVISHATARHFWPGREALGESIEIPSKREADRRSDRLPAFSSARVIGIVGDVIGGYAAVGVYRSCLYFPTSAGAAARQSLLVGVNGGTEAGRRDIRRALDQIGPEIADQINPLDEGRATTIYPFRIAFWIAGFLGALAIVLTVSGIYGVLSYVVSQRTKEIGIRMALGAGRGVVVRMVLSQCMRLVAAGAVLGAGLALLVAPVFANEVEAVQPYDAIAYLEAILLIGAAALAASLRPAQTAVAVDPLSALRCD
jgi:hypothetical protein